MIVLCVNWKPTIEISHNKKIGCRLPVVYDHYPECLRRRERPSPSHAGNSAIVLWFVAWSSWHGLVWGESGTIKLYQLKSWWMVLFFCSLNECCVIFQPQFAFLKQFDKQLVSLSWNHGRCPMTPKPKNQECRYDPEPSSEDCDRRDDERRKKHSLGYTCMSVVGWICRREKERRKW